MSWMVNRHQKSLAPLTFYYLWGITPWIQQKYNVHSNISAIQTSAILRNKGNAQEIQRNQLQTQEQTAAARVKTYKHTSKTEHH